MVSSVTLTVNIYKIIRKNIYYVGVSPDECMSFFKAKKVYLGLIIFVIGVKINNMSKVSELLLTALSS